MAAVEKGKGKKMKKIALLLLMMMAAPLLAQTAAVNGYCTAGAAAALTSGLKSSDTLQGIVPYCLVTVYLTGTTNKATIYADGNNTPLTNSFTANSDGSWLFYAATGVGYDIVMSGGTPSPVPPNCVGGLAEGAD